MTPEPKSILTSVLVGAVGLLVGWLVTKGFVPEADQSVITNDIAGAIGVTFMGLLTWYKARQHSPPALAAAIATSDPVVLARAVNATDQTALIKTVNGADNGVKVVPATSPTPPINTPLSGVSR